MVERYVFQFSSSAYLEKLSGKKACNLDELLKLIESCTLSSIFYHTFSALRKLREVHVPYTNDFAVWISRNLHEEALAEKLGAINLTEYNTIEKLKTRIVEIIKELRDWNPPAFEKKADEPFYLYDVTRIIYLTDKFAYNLKSFQEVLDSISIDSLYFHFIESRLYNQLHADDISTWIEKSLGLNKLAQSIRNIDINVYTLNEIRAKIAHLIHEHLNKTNTKTIE
ncbi:MAG: hypothetical protein DRG35_02930 [Deltaproteobacteria bacterium]|nr:hypothetical protein [Deltaproteobacteria bacterium]MCD6265584.1 hypothetical protein [Deltaproteobacteria bacterium]RLB16428.1 MAG: hypothetical protein DRG35_02930 [Deltaproteobacteria bacterium]HDH87568.1 hypothetical protein [Desulfobacteraceae bacterium]